MTTRLAYAEIHPDEKADTCAGFLHRAAKAFTALGIQTIERVMTDNALAYRRSHAWRQALAHLGAQAQFTKTLPAPDQRQSRTVQVRHEAPGHIPGAAGRDSKGGSWV